MKQSKKKDRWWILEAIAEGFALIGEIFVGLIKLLVKIFD
jgi:hypothetical protein